MEGRQERRREKSKSSVIRHVQDFTGPSNDYNGRQHGDSRRKVMRSNTLPHREEAEAPAGEEAEQLEGSRSRRGERGRPSALGRCDASEVSRQT